MMSRGEGLGLTNLIMKARTVLYLVLLAVYSTVRVCKPSSSGTVGVQDQIPSALA